jgi:uncharacterized membrane protein YfcA
VILLGLLGLLLADDLQRLNGTKNVLALVANGVAAVMFVLFATDQIDWAAAGLLTLGSAVGGLFGSRYGRRLPPASAGRPSDSRTGPESAPLGSHPASGPAKKQECRADP